MNTLKNPNDNYLRSITEIANFLGVSRSTAQRVKHKHEKIFGTIERKFIVDKNELLNALKSNK